MRRSAAEEIELTARLAKKLGVDTEVGFTGSSIWQQIDPVVPGISHFARTERALS